MGGGGAAAKTVKRPRQQPAHPQYANYWAAMTRKRHTMPHPAQPRHTNHWAPRMQKRHQQEHRPQRPTESSNPTQHAKGRTGDCPGPPKRNNNQTECHTGGSENGLPSPRANFVCSHPMLMGRKVPPPLVYVQNDQRVMGIILRCVCWGTHRLRALSQTLCRHSKQAELGAHGGGGFGTRPWWLALSACGGAYWPLAPEPSAMTSRPPHYCGHPHGGGGGVRKMGSKAPPPPLNLPGAPLAQPKHVRAHRGSE